MSERLLPGEAHVLAAQIEDALRIWNERRDNSWHHETAAAVERAVKLYGDLIVRLNLARDELFEQMRKYNAARDSFTSYDAVMDLDGNVYVNPASTQKPAH